jgi:hypothetical protein
MGTYNDKPSNGTKIPRDRKKKQGVWADDDGMGILYSATTATPVDLFIYPTGQEPTTLEGSRHIYGIWGSSGVVNPNKEDD